MDRLKLIPFSYLSAFEKYAGSDIDSCIEMAKAKEPNVNQFMHYTTASAVASAQIEGSTLDLNSFLVAKQNKNNSKEVHEIEGLIAAYQFAMSEQLNYKNFLKCHSILSASFKYITNGQKGKLRKTAVGISDFHGLVYLAIEPDKLPGVFKDLFNDIEVVTRMELTNTQLLFYASWVHFLFAKIHPFADGNGRAARILEKWLLAGKLGATAWSLPTERYYWDNRPDYYHNLNIGRDYYDTMERLHLVTPFTAMLPKAVCYHPLF